MPSFQLAPRQGLWKDQTPLKSLPLAQRKKTFGLALPAPSMVLGEQPADALPVCAADFPGRECPDPLSRVGLG